MKIFAKFALIDLAKFAVGGIVFLPPMLGVLHFVRPQNNIDLAFASGVTVAAIVLPISVLAAAKTEAYLTGILFDEEESND